MAAPVPLFINQLNQSIMKTTMNLATSKGFIFRNGKLMAYEFISALVDYHNENVEYTCKLGGAKTIFMADECPVVYESVEAFRVQKALESVAVRWSDMLRMTFRGLRTYGTDCDATGELTMWAVKDNKPVPVQAPKANFLYRAHWDVDYVGKGDFLNSREIALKHCDLIKVDENGVETREASAASKMKLSDEQMTAIEAVKKALENAKEMGVQIIMDTGSCEVVAFSTSHIEKFEVDYDCCGKHDGDVEYGDLVQRVPLDIYDANLADYPLYVTWK